LPVESSVTAEPPMDMVPFGVASENVTVPVGVAPPARDDTLAAKVICAEGL
jgi:hypothetical protein